MNLIRLLVVLAFALMTRAQAPPLVWSESFAQASGRWQVHGDSQLFAWDASMGALDVTWNSEKANSYYYLPLGMVLTRADDFRLTFSIVLNRIAIGTTDGKDYTFQIAAGLLNLSNAFDSAFYRGSGIEPRHGARNLVEFNYFPDSGFGATVAPSIATASNQIAFSGNYPLEMAPGELYRVEMKFDATTQTLASRLWRNGELYPPEGLKPLKLPANFADFRLDGLAIASYSDAGQTAQFAGSIEARGWIDDIDLQVWHRVPVRITAVSGAVSLSFPTEVGWTYQVESSTELTGWTATGDAIAGTGAGAATTLTNKGGIEFFRVRGSRPQG